MIIGVVFNAGEALKGADQEEVEKERTAR